MLVGSSQLSVQLGVTRDGRVRYRAPVSTGAPPELALPANPNGVSFAAEASDVLLHRTWADVQRLAARVATPFHAQSGLAILVGLSWRVALDRRNRRHTQVTFYFVFDGPATANHLDTLDAAMEREGLGFGAGSIERVPANGIPTVILARGSASRVLRADDGTPPIFRKLVMEDTHVKPVSIPMHRALEADYAGELPAVIGVPAPYGDAERETERMRLAFARHFSTRIVEADGVVRSDEKAFMDEMFPMDLIERLGLADAAVQAEYLEAACANLAGRLGHHDKLALIGLFFSACFADGSLDAREMRVLKEAGDQLGLKREEVVKYLRRFW